MLQWGAFWRERVDICSAAFNIYFAVALSAQHRRCEQACNFVAISAHTALYHARKLVRLQQPPGHWVVHTFHCAAVTNDAVGCAHSCSGSPTCCQQIIHLLVESFSKAVASTINFCHASRWLPLGVPAISRPAGANKVKLGVFRSLATSTRVVAY